MYHIVTEFDDQASIHEVCHHFQSLTCHNTVKILGHDNSMLKDQVTKDVHKVIVLDL